MKKFVCITHLPEKMKRTCLRVLLESWGKGLKHKYDVRHLKRFEVAREALESRDHLSLSEYQTISMCLTAHEGPWAKDEFQKWVFDAKKVSVFYHLGD